MNILVVRRHNQIGDMLMSVPLYKALKTQYPGSFIKLVASPTNYPIPFKIINPFIDNVIIFPETKKNILGFHRGAGKSANTWSKDNFISLIEKLNGRYYNYTLIMCGEIDKEVINIIEKGLTHKGVKFIKAENFSITHLAAILERINLYITNDTEPMHIAAATKVNQISLMLPDNEYEWAPRGGKNNNGS